MCQSSSVVRTFGVGAIKAILFVVASALRAGAQCRSLQERARLRARVRRCRAWQNVRRRQHHLPVVGCLWRLASRDGRGARAVANVNPSISAAERNVVSVRKQVPGGGGGGGDHVRACVRAGANVGVLGGRDGMSAYAATTVFGPAERAACARVRVRARVRAHACARRSKQVAK